MKRRVEVGQEVHQSQMEEGVEQNQKVGAGEEGQGEVKGLGGSSVGEIVEELEEGGMDSAC